MYRSHATTYIIFFMTLLVHYLYNWNCFSEARLCLILIDSDLPCDFPIGNSYYLVVIIVFAVLVS